MNRLHGDCARAALPHLLGPIAHLLREEEAAELAGLHVEVLVAMLEAYDVQRERERARLDPTKN